MTQLAVWLTNDEADDTEKAEYSRLCKIEKFLSYFNDFLTIPRFAEYYELSEHNARVIINKGRKLHQDQFGHH
mgnify:CR=1 FL=1